MLIKCLIGRYIDCYTNTNYGFLFSNKTIRYSKSSPLYSLLDMFLNSQLLGRLGEGHKQHIPLPPPPPPKGWFLVVCHLKSEGFFWWDFFVISKSSICMPSVLLNLMLICFCV